MKKRILAVSIILFGILVLFIYFFKPDADIDKYSVDEQEIENIIYYSNGKKNDITRENDIYNNIQEEILYIINNLNNNDVCKDTIDGSLLCDRYGMPVGTDQQQYFIKVTFKTPVIIRYLNRDLQDIVTVIFSLEKESGYIYLYNEMSDKKNSSIVGLACNGIYNLKNMYDIKNYFS